VSRSISYKKAGVDVGSAEAFIGAIKPLAGLTRQPGLLRGIGSFGGLFQLNSHAGHDSVLVASADGVGTKLVLARLVKWYTPLGVDLVAMNVNDILCVGAKPLFFLDYIAAGKLQQRVLLDVVRGVVRGCVESECVLLGGETAQMPLVYKPEDFDLAGFAVGIVKEKRAKAVGGGNIRPGHALLGLASNGIHANGFTLVQKVLSKKELIAQGRELLKPTRIYVRPVLDLLDKKVPVHGIAHITGGSFENKLPRVLPAGIDAVIDRGSWTVPPVFKRLEAAGVSNAEMFHTFNMGLGMVLVLPKPAVARARRLLKKHGLASWVVGETVKGGRKVRFE
jgi:phosphoribosylformylglycinamidine cyclo-ligase